MKHFLVFLSLVMACDGISFVHSLQGGEAVSSREEFPVKVVKVDGIEIEILMNSETFSQASAINSLGSIIGTREVSGEQTGVISQKSFFYGEIGHKDMPLPESFTNVEATALSDNDLVAGYATRPIGNPKGNLDAVLWDPKADTILVLPRAEGDSACHAQSISADGSLIAGYSTGPSRMRPVIWKKERGSEEWQVTVLPTVHANNPYLMSSSVQLSPDGTMIAGCCTEAFLPSGIIDSSLYLWSKDDRGDWQQKRLSEHQIYIKGFNNKGEVVGIMRETTGLNLPCYFSPTGERVMLSLLAGDESGEALGINDKSVIVGFSDDPRGPEGGPEPCRWEIDGKVTAVKLGAVPFGAVHDVNDASQMAGMATLVELAESVGAENGPVAERVLAFRTKKR